MNVSRLHEIAKSSNDLGVHHIQLSLPKDNVSFVHIESTSHNHLMLEVMFQALEWQEDDSPIQCTPNSPIPNLRARPHTGGPARNRGCNQGKRTNGGCIRGSKRGRG